MADHTVDSCSPPNDREAERSVLGAMMRDNSQISDVVRILKPESFYQFAHRAVFEAIVRLFEQGKPADSQLVADELHTASRVADVGGYGYLVELWDAAPAATHAAHYAAIVREKAVRRELLSAGQELMRRAVDPAEQTAEVLAEAERRLFTIAIGREGKEPVSVADITREAYGVILARAAGDRAVTGCETGWFDLDALTCGFQPAELIIIGARPSVGKTAFMAGCVLHLASQGIPTLTFSLEQRPVEIGERLLSAWAGVNSHRTRKGTITGADVAALDGALRDFAAFPGHVSTLLDVTPRDILAESRRWKVKHGIRAVFVDYLQLVTPQEVRGIPRHEQVAATTRRLKLMARELQIPVVVLAQLNRDLEDGAGRRPRLSDLKESGAIEQDADTVLFVHRPADATDKREIIVAKQRNGPTGDVVLTFRKEFMRFENATPDTPADWK